MKIWRAILNAIEWLPIIAAPFAVAILTDNFTHGLATETWLILVLALALNLAWLWMMRWARFGAEFYKKYPGFRVKR